MIARSLSRLRNLWGAGFDILDEAGWGWRSVFIVTVAFLTVVGLGFVQTPRDADSYIARHTRVQFALRGRDAITPILMFESKKVGGIAWDMDSDRILAPVPSLAPSQRLRDLEECLVIWDPRPLPLAWAMGADDLGPLEALSKLKIAGPVAQVAEAIGQGLSGYSLGSYLATAFNQPLMRRVESRLRQPATWQREERRMISRMIRRMRPDSEASIVIGLQWRASSPFTSLPQSERLMTSCAAIRKAIHR